MILKSAMIAAGLMGLMYGGTVLAASSLVCAAYAFCNATSQECNMVGEINNSFYRYDRYFYKNISELVPFYGAASADVSSGQLLCSFGFVYPSPVSASFASRANIKLYPDTTIDNEWLIDDDSATCFNETENLSNKDCPFTPTPPVPRARR